MGAGGPNQNTSRIQHGEGYTALLYVFVVASQAVDADPQCRLAHVPHNVSQMCFERRSSVLISDDNGLHWHESQGTYVGTLVTEH